MTAFTWIARDRNVVGVSAAPDVDTPVVLQWSADPAVAASSLPWAVPEYPTLLIQHVAFDLLTDVVERRVRLTLTQPGGGKTVLVSSQPQGASLLNRWEWAVMLSAPGTANDVLSEVLPHGLLLLPGLVGQTPATLQVEVIDSAADDLGPVVVGGVLLYP